MAARSEPAARRRYSSPRRARQAAQTRADVLDAAVRLFTARGWTGTTLQAVAGEAGVAVETVYGAFGSKKLLLRAALDTAIVGDTGDEPLADRAEYRALGRGRRHERMLAGVRMLAAIHGRTAPLWRAMKAAAAADGDVAAWCEAYEKARHEEVGRALSLVLGRAVDGRLLDLMWAYLGPEVYAQLVLECGWSVQAYREWMVRTVTALAARGGTGSGGGSGGSGSTVGRQR